MFQWSWPRLTLGISPANPVKYDAVLLDLDGTLVDFHLKVIDLRRALIRELATLGFNASKFSESDPTQAIYDTVEREAATGRFALSLPQIKDRLGEILDRFEEDAFKATRRMPEAIPVLRTLRGAGLKVALVTNSGSRATRKALLKHGLRRYFDTVVTRNEAMRLKPSGAGLRVALERLNISADRAVYVGDSVLDIAAARDAGVATIAIASGVHPEDRLRASRPDWLVRSLKDLLPILL